MNSSLFRSEIVEQQHQRLMGAISLAQPVSIYVWCACLVTLFALVVTFLLFSEHHRKERVRGYLVPDKGLLRIHGTHSATIEAIHVREGEQVEPGDLMVSLIRDQTTVDGAGLRDVVLERLNQRLQLVDDAIVDNQHLLEEQLSSNQQRLLGLKLETEHLSHQLSLAEARIAIQRKRLRAQQNLHSAGYLSAVHLDQSEEAFLAEQLGVGQLRAQLMSVGEERKRAMELEAQLPLQFEMKINELKRRASELGQQLSEVEASSQPDVRATESGIVTAVNAVEGQVLEPGQTLLTLIPAESTLIAELYLPTRSIGQIQVGHRARLRFDAFPYQQFGLMDAEILQVDRALKGPGANSPLIVHEPVYRVRAVLYSQSMKAYPLRAGMLLEADILLEKRRLLDWALAPLTGLRERLG